MTLRSFLGSLALCAALLPGQEAAAQGGTTPPKPAAAAPQPGAAPEPNTDNGDDGPGVKVGVSLADGIVNRRLPFDVPFYLTGTAGTDVTGIESRVYRIGRKALVTAVVTELAKTTDCVPTAIAADVREVSHSFWTGTAGSGFVLLIEPLAPQRYYAFCFVMTGPVAPKEVEDPIRRSLADATTLMLSKEEPGDLTLAFANNFQSRLADSIEELGSRRSVKAEIPNGNIFHRETRVERGSPLARLLSAMVDPYQEMRRQKDQYDKRLDQLINLTEQTSILLPSTLVNVMPTAEDRLPDRIQAVLSRTAFDVSSFEFKDAIAVLNKEQIAAATRGDGAAAKTIKELASHVEALRDIAEPYGRDYELLRDAAQQIVNSVQLQARDVSVGLNSSVLSAELNRNTYVSLDAGIAYPWQLENMVFYAGTNIYFRPVNKKAPLGRSFLSRVAMTIGITTTVQDSRRRAEDLRTATSSNPTTNSLLLGVGLRVTPSLRISAGALIFKETDPNPLITERSVAATPFAAFSIDVDLGNLFKGLF